MDQESTAALVNMGTQLAILAAKGTASTVSAKISSIKQKKNLDEVCNAYDEIVSELISERSDAVMLAQAYESELKRYEISDQDIEHLQNTATEALDIFVSFTPDANKEALEQFKKLISIDTLKAMQLLGFDYKAAIGDPLTQLCASAIKSLGTQKKTPVKGAQRR